MKIIANISKRLQRDTGKKKLIPEIDGLRSLALLPVIFMHFNTNYKRYLGQSLGEGYESVVGNGVRGVFLFFAISGFILSLGFFNALKNNRGGIDYKNYLMRRLTRLEPPFIISTLVLFLMVQFSFDGAWRALLVHLLPTLTYTHHLIFGYWSPINPVTWSLEVEIQFYLLIPFFCAFLFRKSENYRYVLLCILIILLPFLFVQEGSFFRSNPHFKRSLPVYVGYFLTGVLFLNLFTSAIWRKIKPSFLWDIAGVCSIVVFLSMEFGSVPLESMILCLLILLIFVSVFKGLLLNGLFSNNAVVIFGGMCYSIYLLHYPVIFGISKMSGYISLPDNLSNYVFQFLLAFVCIFVISAIFFVLFEKPFMKRDWWRPKSKEKRSV